MTKSAGSKKCDKLSDSLRGILDKKLEKTKQKKMFVSHLLKV